MGQLNRGKVCPRGPKEGDDGCSVPNMYIIYMYVYYTCILYICVYIPAVQVLDDGENLYRFEFLNQACNVSKRATSIYFLVPSYFTRSQDEGMPGQRYRIRPLDIVSESFVFKGHVLQVESSSNIFTFRKRTPLERQIYWFSSTFSKLVFWCKPIEI